MANDVHLRHFRQRRARRGAGECGMGVSGTSHFGGVDPFAAGTGHLEYELLRHCPPPSAPSTSRSISARLIISVQHTSMQFFFSG